VEFWGRRTKGGEEGEPKKKDLALGLEQMV